MRKAVIDVGSNSVLLLVAEKAETGWRTIYESTSVTSLGAGTKATGLLSKKSIDDTLEALRVAFDAARGHGASTVRAAATMAARIATNTEEFLQAAQAQGTPVEVLSGEEEAQLGFKSVADDPTFSRHERLSIVDVGGQSTELVTADRKDGDWVVSFRRSYPIGTLALRGGTLSDPSPASSAQLRALGEIDEAIGLSYLPQSGGYVVALGATGTNLVTIREAMTTWNPEAVHGAWLDYEEVGKAVGWLSGMTDEERAKVPGMERGREQTIHIGALILERFLFSLKVLGCAVSVRGWRHAMLEREVY